MQHDRPHNPGGLSTQVIQSLQPRRHGRGRYLVGALLGIALILTGVVSIGWLTGHAAWAGEVGVFGTSQNFEVKTKDSFLYGPRTNRRGQSRSSGCVAAQGEGQFIATSSDSPMVSPGTAWKAYGMDRLWWGSLLKFPSPALWTKSKGELRCRVEIPALGTQKAVRLKGYLRVRCVFAERVTDSTFQNVYGDVQSKEFRLNLYPSRESNAKGVDDVFNVLAAFAAVFGLAWLIAWMDRIQRRLEKG
jgi:hypothetical protein